MASPKFLKPVSRQIRWAITPAKGRLRRSFNVFSDRRKRALYIFRDVKVAYIPVPKVASSSILTALLPLTGKPSDVVERVHADGAFTSENWSRAQSFIDSEWFVFSVVRNPIDRALSAWKNKVFNKTGIPVPMREMGVTSEDSLDSFITKLASWPTRAMDSHIMPQSDMFHEIGPHLIDIYHFETLSDDWSRIAREINNRGGNVPLTLPHRNPSGKRMDVSEEGLQLLRQVYQRDLEQFGYS